MLGWSLPVFRKYVIVFYDMYIMLMLCWTLPVFSLYVIMLGVVQYFVDALLAFACLRM
jgi:hypothetical protein